MIQINKPVNLGMGYPDYNAQPKSIMDAMTDISLNGDYKMNQYTRANVSK